MEKLLEIYQKADMDLKKIKGAMHKLKQTKRENKDVPEEIADLLDEGTFEAFFMIIYAIEEEIIKPSLATLLDLQETKDRLAKRYFAHIAYHLPKKQIILYGKGQLLSECNANNPSEIIRIAGNLFIKHYGEKEFLEKIKEERTRKIVHSSDLSILFRHKELAEFFVTNKNKLIKEISPELLFISAWAYYLAIKPK